MTDPLDPDAANRLGLTLRSYDATSATGILHDVLIPVWEAVYADIAADDPFFTTKRFLQRFDGYTRAPGFSLCTATQPTGQPVGLAFGYTLQPGSRWWSGLQTPMPDDFTTEDGHRTFAINEIMVLEPHRRHGIATALHRELLSTRPEPRATLLVEPDNHPARNAYLHWGWQPIGTLKPFPDSPTYDSMIITLPLP
jgi:ribosomal protein S18 acetylase RimI-like enzyme